MQITGVFSLLCTLPRELWLSPGSPLCLHHRVERASRLISSTFILSRFNTLLCLFHTSENICFVYFLQSSA